ncbi:MAG: hypothetical protein PHC28_04850 [Flavobacterium sp.]|uniref:hypothetical protein n=1 Tax=Flavobacterium sp. TaxID=239 RepID=UPI0026396D31|nr:hypothetical protein [Flavobacterium sp.]MDD5149794.1 hypothetical protein [Flavobacterium sp.]
MLIEDFFDPGNIVHLRCWDYLNKHGHWEEHSIMLDFDSSSPAHIVNIAFKIANFYTKQEIEK